MNVTIEQLIIDEDKTIGDALKCIDSNAQGICFIINTESFPVGVLTDGDIRRAFINGADLAVKVTEVMNRDFTIASVDTTPEKINQMLNEKIRHIPLTDKEGKLIDFASLSRNRRIPIMQVSLSGNEMQYVSNCISTGWISSQGSYVKEFEKLFAAYCGAPYALAVSNGTTALHLALACLKIGPGDEVIVPDFTFAASINAVLYTGATPVLVDVSLDTWTIDIEQLEAAITAKTKAIMPVHIYGQPCNMEAIMSIAKKHNLFVVEDCAEALGSKYNNQHVGSFGEVGTFSFFGNKTITTGEGGMLIFKDKATYEFAAVLRDHGMSKEKRYWHDVVGFNYRMTNLQAAIGVAQMERIEEIVAKKRLLADTYNSALNDLHGLQLQAETKGTFSSYWLYTMLVNPPSGFTREALQQSLAKSGVESRPAFFCLHTMPVYEAYKQDRSFDNSAYISAHGLSLPSYIDLTQEELTHIMRTIKDLYSIKSLTAS